MTLLAINWAEFGIKGTQLILCIAIIVTLHELGHFLAARWFKCRVEKFYLFFNPWFSLWKKKIGETEYGIGWIPFGGYVKIAGMIDESMDKEQMKQPAKPDEFRSKRAWQRLIIMLAGIIMNLLLGFTIYAMLLWQKGEEYVPVNKFTYGISTDSLAQSIGLRDGDQLLSVDGKYIDKFSRVPLLIILNGAKTIQVERGKAVVNIDIPEDFPGKLIKYRSTDFISMRVPFTAIDSLADTSAALKAGLQKGDRIIAANGMTTNYLHEFRKLVQKNRNKAIPVKFIRGTDTMETTVKVPENGVIGIYNKDIKNLFEVKKVKYNLLQSIPAGFRKGIETLQSYLLQLKLIFSGKVNTNETLGSVISIGKMFPSTWDWEGFWSLTAFISFILAIMNLLPIPGLDGGHALFTLYEMITGRKPGDKFMEYAQLAGMILLLGLMAYALGLDIFRLFK